MPAKLSTSCFLSCSQLQVHYIFICKKRWNWILNKRLVFSRFCKICFLAVFVRFVRLFFICLRAKKFSLDGHLLYLFLILDLVIIALLSSFVINRAWFSLTCFCFSRAWLSKVDRKMIVMSPYLTPLLHSLVRSLFSNSCQKSFVSNYLKFL